MGAYRVDVGVGDGPGLTTFLRLDRSAARPGTAVSAWWTEGGMNSFSTANLKILTIRAIRWLIVRRHRPDSIIRWRTDFSAFGPKAVARVEPKS